MRQYCILIKTQDNDDDGESAAGNRIAHLLSILVSIVLQELYILIYHRMSIVCP